MKHLLYLLIIITFTYSCDNKKKMREQQVLDSIANIEKMALDSIEKKRIDSLALIAWGDAKFGMSMEEVLKTKALRNCKKNGSILIFPTENIRIADTKLAIGEFKIIFENDELTEIKISSNSEHLDRVDDLVSDAIKISNEFQNKYGEPAESSEKRVSISDLTKDELFVLKTWMIGDSKIISVYLGENKSYRDTYFYLIAITNYYFPTKIKKVIFTEEGKKQIRERKEREEQEKYQF